jgi:hypothetical protein
MKPTLTSTAVGKVREGSALSEVKASQSRDRGGLWCRESAELVPNLVETVETMDGTGPRRSREALENKAFPRCPHA